jgi:hypothetical protein
MFQNSPPTQVHTLRERFWQVSSTNNELFDMCLYDLQRYATNQQSLKLSPTLSLFLSKKLDQ